MINHLSNTKAWGSKLQKLNRSSNGMFLIVIFLLISNFVGWVAYLKASHHYIVISVPPHVSAPFTVTDQGVNASYLKQMTLFYINTRLNFTDKTIAGADEVILDNTDSQYYASLKGQLLKEQQYIKTHKVSSYFVPTLVKVDPVNLSAVVQGRLQRWVGLSSVGAEHNTYILNFTYQGGMLKIKSFQEQKNEDEN